MTVRVLSRKLSALWLQILLHWKDHRGINYLWKYMLDMSVMSGFLSRHSWYSSWTDFINQHILKFLKPFLPHFRRMLHVMWYKVVGAKSTNPDRFISRCHFVEEERNVLLQVRREMSEEFKDSRKKLEDSLRELEIIKRKALRLEDENKHLVSFITSLIAWRKSFFFITMSFVTENDCWHIELELLLAQIYCQKMLTTWSWLRWEAFSSLVLMICLSSLAAIVDLPRNGYYSQIYFVTFFGLKHEHDCCGWKDFQSKTTLTWHSVA